jgi:hypothetical protein
LLDAATPPPYLGAMLIEMHCHTSEHSPCSRVRAVDHVRDCLRRGMDGLVLTDHHYLWREIRAGRCQPR